MFVAASWNFKMRPIFETTRYEHVYFARPGNNNNWGFYIKLVPETLALLCECDIRWNFGFTLISRKESQITSNRNSIDEAIFISTLVLSGMLI